MQREHGRCYSIPPTSSLGMWLQGEENVAIHQNCGVLLSFVPREVVGPALQSVLPPLLILPVLSRTQPGRGCSSKRRTELSLSGALLTTARSGQLDDPAFLWVCPSLLSLSQGQKTWLWERHHLVFVLGTPACHGWATRTGLVLASATWSWAEVGNSFCVWISCSFVPFCSQYCSVPLRFLSHCCLFSVNCYPPHSLCLCPSLTESGGKREVEQLIWNLIPTTGTRNLENGLVLQLTAGKRTSSVQHF